MASSPLTRGSCVAVDLNFSSKTTSLTHPCLENQRISCSGTFLDQNAGLAVTSGVIFSPLLRMQDEVHDEGGPGRKLDLFFSANGKVLHRDIFSATSEIEQNHERRLPTTKGCELIHYIESLCEISVYVDSKSDYYDRQVNAGSGDPIDELTSLLTKSVTGGHPSSNHAAKGVANKRWLKQTATILAIWRCDEVAAVLDDVFTPDSWSLSDDRSAASRALEDQARSLLPFFALLKVKPISPLAGANVQLDRLIRPLRLRTTVLPFLRSEIDRITAGGDTAGGGNPLDVIASLLSRYADRMGAGCRAVLDRFLRAGIGDRVPCVRARCREALQRAARHLCQTPALKVGGALSVVATPFGGLRPTVFLNSVSKGVITNVAGDNGAMIMTDARCVPGCEGGGVYLDSDTEPRELMGVVITPFCWRQNEWVGLTFVAAIHSVVGSLFWAAGRSPGVIVSPTPTPGQLMGGGLNENVALVKVGTSWGSAVLVAAPGGGDRKFLLTCSHVVQDNVGRVLRIRFNRNTEDVFDELYVSAKVIYCTPERSTYDVAVLEVDPRDSVNLPVGLELSATESVEGDSTFAVGHGLFDEDMHLPASVTSGVISKILSKNGKQVLIQSTCAVHPGASGGALVNSRTGQVCGIIVSNAKDEMNGACYPHLNLSIPSTILTNILESYTKTGDLRVLEKFHEVDPDICCFWQLGYSPIRKLHSKL